MKQDEFQEMAPSIFNQSIYAVITISAIDVF